MKFYGLSKSDIILLNGIRDNLNKRFLNWSIGKNYWDNQFCIAINKFRFLINNLKLPGKKEIKQNIINNIFNDFISEIIRIIYSVIYESEIIYYDKCKSECKSKENKLNFENFSFDENKKVKKQEFIGGILLIRNLFNHMVITRGVNNFKESLFKIDQHFQNMKNIWEKRKSYIKQKEKNGIKNQKIIDKKLKYIFQIIKEHENNEEHIEMYKSDTKIIEIDLWKNYITTSKYDFKINLYSLYYYLINLYYDLSENYKNFFDEENIICNECIKNHNNKRSKKVEYICIKKWWEK